jgi:hypothetical protein
LNFSKVSGLPLSLLQQMMVRTEHIFHLHDPSFRPAPAAGLGIVVNGLDLLEARKGGRRRGTRAAWIGGVARAVQRTVQLREPCSSENRAVQRTVQFRERDAAQAGPVKCPDKERKGSALGAPSKPVVDQVGLAEVGAPGNRGARAASS